MHVHMHIYMCIHVDFSLKFISFLYTPVCVYMHYIYTYRGYIKKLLLCTCCTFFVFFNFSYLLMSVAILCHSAQGEVIEAVRPHLWESCSVLPRLSYLSDAEALRVISHTGSPTSLLPLVRRMFPSLGGLRFVSSGSSSSPSIQAGSSSNSNDEGRESVLLPCVLFCSVYILSVFLFITLHCMRALVRIVMS